MEMKLVENILYKKILSLLALVFTFIKYKMQRVKPFNNSKSTIALQLNNMDKGGLEEVVLQLATCKQIREKYNVVIISEFSNKGYLADIARQQGIPVYSFFKNTINIPKLIKTLNIKLVHFHYNFTGIKQYKNYAVKTLYTIHNNYIWLDKKDIEWRNKYYPYIDQFIAVSSQVQRYFCEKFDIDKSKVLVIQNGIQYVDDIENLTPFSKTQVGFSKNDFVILNIASFNPNKYHFTQLKALSEVNKRYKNIKLLLIGNIHDKFYYEKIKNMILALKLEENVRILNFVPKTDIFKYLKMSDCFILTSLTEGFSIAMAEAMMCCKPMILTDVGGARDVINNNDIGILVPHAFKNMQKFNIMEVINQYSQNKFYFDNLKPIINAIEHIYLERENWNNKALLGKKKIKEKFNIKITNEKYLQQYKKLDYTVNKNYIEQLLRNNDFELAIMAPCPLKQQINEGWMSRIFAIDNIISNKKRIYINPFLPVEGINIYKHTSNLFEIQINKTNLIFSEIVELIVQNVKILYCHTLHLAEYIISQLATNKIVVDIHGVTPEEEVMLGNPHLKEKYELIEQQVLQKAKCCIMVSNAMQKHYKNKYPAINPNSIILPIVELLDVDEKSVEKIYNCKNNEIIYSGGVQVWQNLEAMLHLATNTNYHYTFLSSDYEIIKRKAKKLKIKNAVFKVASKKELKEIYNNIKFGIILRDDSPVNFVSCPTKIYEYMACGIIPIIRTSKIGDLDDLGFKYITEKEVLDNNLPPVKKQREIILNNFNVVKKMQNMFKNASLQLLDIVTEENNFKC